ncbi:hypothetical protein [Streptomyces acidiscabies]|uniref:Uncharacterized protein n=1 Tax=Streptomyces acidiscabies TaxID=42234 RepID=A0ABU4LYI5_9ACTN|nr:hypothetical protein [Streptomyces acidiscabies]MDX3020018.1 hypothetical protein [Streptomyces acidiscabies]
MSRARTVEVVWYYREPRGGPGQHESAERKTDVVLLEKHADGHNMSPDVFSEVRRSLAVKYFEESLKGNNIFADSITNVCNCESTAACEYAESDGYRFSLSDGTRIGSMTIRENMPNPHEDYPDAKLAVENVKKQWAELTLAAIIEQEGHR